MTLPPHPPGLPHWTWAEFATAIQAQIAKSVRQLEIIAGNPALRGSQMGRDLARMHFNQVRAWYSGLEAIEAGGYSFAGQVQATAPAIEGLNVPVTTVAAQGEGALAGQGASAAGFSQPPAASRAAQSASRLRVLLGSPAVAVTLVAVLAIVAVGIYANSRQSSVLEKSRLWSSVPDPEERFIGPEPPEGTCTGDVAGQHGLVWTEEWGWRAPDADPEPALYEYPDDQAGYAAYLADYDAWEIALRERVAAALGEAAQECGDALVAGAVPDDAALCSFFPESMVGGIPRSAAINDGSDAASACVFRDGRGGPGVWIWAELFGLTGGAGAAQERVQTLHFMESGSASQLPLGDGAWLIEQRNPERHILTGSSGPLFFVFYACSACEGTMTAELQPLAEHVLDACADWAAAR